MSNEGMEAERLFEALHHRAHLTAGTLASVRRILADWAAAAGLDRDMVDAVVLSGYETLANSVEHAYSLAAGGVVELDAIRVGDAVTLTVTDHGRWQIPSSVPGNRGRGLTIVRGLSDRADVAGTDGGTTVTMTWLLDDRGQKGASG